MAIPIQDARGIFNKALIARWNELLEIAPTGFLCSCCETVTSDSKEVSIEVVRGTEKIAVDVLRGANGNRNTFSKSTEKIFIPPFYNEFFDATELDKYDAVFGINQTEASAGSILSVTESALEKLQILRYKIQRAYELQCSQVFESGIVQLKSGDNIDFKRKAASMVVNQPAQYWSNKNVDPREQLKAAGTFLRTVGKALDGEFNVFCGANAASALISNPFIDNNNYKTLSLVELLMPQKDAMGGVYHGTISAGPYKFHIWSYPEFYDDANGVATPYIKDDYVYIHPVRSLKCKLSFGSVPKIIRDARNVEFPELISQTQTDYAVNNYIDPFGKKHVFEVLSAGICIPVSIDRMYSAKVTGNEVVGG